jgi:hypothetical protein
MALNGRTDSQRQFHTQKGPNAAGTQKPTPPKSWYLCRPVPRSGSPYRVLMPCFPQEIQLMIDYAATKNVKLMGYVYPCLDFVGGSGVMNTLPAPEYSVSNTCGYPPTAQNENTRRLFSPRHLSPCCVNVVCVRVCVCVLSVLRCRRRSRAAPWSALPPLPRITMKRSVRRLWYS